MPLFIAQFIPLCIVAQFIPSTQDTLQWHPESTLRFRTHMIVSFQIQVAAKQLLKTELYAWLEILE
jgi:hypothetical protein